MTEKKEKDESNNEKPKISVTDRRHWVGKIDDEEVDDDKDLDKRYPSFVEKLKLEAEEKDKRLREYIAAYKTKTNETDELRQRLQRENEARLEQIKANFFQKLIPIIDNLRRALEAANNDSGASSLKKGIEMTLSQFIQELDSHGVTKIEAVGRPFDPKTDEVLLTVETDDPGKENLVLEELEPGYMLKDKLLKAVKVKVAKLKAPSHNS